MRILWVKMGGLWPATTGGRVRSLQIVSELARRHQVTVVTTHGPGDDPEGLARQLSHCHRVISIPVCRRRSAATPPFRRGRAVVAVALSGRSVEVARAGGASTRCDRSIESGDVDLCVTDFLFAAVNVPMRRPVPVVLFEHNVEYLIWQRLCALESTSVAARAVRDRMAEAARARGGRVPAGDLTIAVSEDDRRRLEALAPGMRGASIPTGVDTDYFMPDGHANDPTHSCSAARWTGIPTRTRSSISPTRSCRGSVRKSPTSRSPSSAATRAARLRELATRAGIVVTGTVDDVRPSIGEAAVYVVPLRAGGGTRLKIFEALAMGKAVVSTTVGAEGLRLEPAATSWPPTTRRRLPNAVVSLLRDPEQRRALGQAGRSARRGLLLVADDRPRVRRTM